MLVLPLPQKLKIKPSGIDFVPQNDEKMVLFKHALAGFGPAERMSIPCSMQLVASLDR